jgi:hypothetical protein
MSSPDTRFFIKGANGINEAVWYLRSMQDEDIYAFEIKPVKSIRTAAQNALMWVYNTAIGKQTIPPHPKDNIHLWARYKIIGAKQKFIIDTNFSKVPETHNMTVKEMIDYITELEALALTHGYDLPCPPYREEALR